MIHRISEPSTVCCEKINDARGHFGYHPHGICLRPLRDPHLRILPPGRAVITRKTSLVVITPINLEASFACWDIPPDRLMQCNCSRLEAVQNSFMLGPWNMLCCCGSCGQLRKQLHFCTAKAPKERQGDVISVTCTELGEHDIHDGDCQKKVIQYSIFLQGGWCLG